MGLLINIMKINHKQIENVLSLSGSKRYEYFIKVVADWEKVWGLYKDGWALAATDNWGTVFPLWPAKEYAELCAVNEWHEYKPESFSLEELLDKLLPKLKSDGILPGVFYTPYDTGVTPTIDQLDNDLRNELKNY